MKKLLFLLMGTLITLPTFAQDFEYTYEGQTLKYTITDETAKLCCVSEDNSVSGALVIPSIVKYGDTDYSVTEIEGYAFYRCSGLMSVTIPNTVTSIEDSTFKECSGAMLRRPF